MTPSSAAPERSSARGGVYIIDDDFDIVALMASVLSEAGYRVETATDPVAAFKKELPFRPDVLLVDILMPGMSGIELMEKIGHVSGRNSFRIITVSSLTAQDDIERATRAGADDYLAKPFHPEELLLRVGLQMKHLAGSGMTEIGTTDHTRAHREIHAQVSEKRVSPSVESPPLGPRSAPSGAKILIVDDDPDIRSIVKSTFYEGGHRVIQAGDGEEGIDLALREEPDLIVLDIEMPRMSGFEVVNWLSANPLTRAIPVLILSARNTPQDVVEGLTGYADEYITKPFRPEELLARAGALIRLTREHTREKREQRWVIQQLADKGLRRGWQAFSPYLENAPSPPATWKGPAPDLLMQHGKRQTAYLVVSAESLHDERTIVNWQEVERLKGVDIRIVGMSRETAGLASRIKRERNFRARVQWTRPRKPREPGWVEKIYAPWMTKYVAAIFVALVFSLFVSGYVPNVFELLNRMNLDLIYEKEDPRTRAYERRNREIVEDSRRIQK